MDFQFFEFSNAFPANFIEFPLQSSSNVESAGHTGDGN